MVHYRQTRGVAMGARCAPLVANLFLGWWEREIVWREDLSQYHRHIIGWYRFIDDILIIWHGPEDLGIQFMEQLNKNEFNIFLTYTISPHQATYLDLDLHVEENGTIRTTLHRKKTATNNLLCFDSFHQDNLKKGIPVVQLLRARRNCSLDADFLKEAKEMEGRFRNRGYPKNIIRKAFKRARDTPRENLLRYKQKNKENQEVRYVTQYNSNWNNLRSILRAHWNILKTDPYLTEWTKRGPLMTAKRAPNLRDKLCSSHYTRPKNWLEKNMMKGSSQPCGRCNICRLVKRKETIQSVTTGQKYGIKQQLNCRSEGVIYLLECSCPKQYVGETKNAGKTRIQGHLSNIKLAKRDKEAGKILTPVAAHFLERHEGKSDNLQVTFIEKKMGQSLSLSVCTKVHGSAEIWSCNYGQGQYMSFTAHWVNVVPAQQLGQVTSLRPPLSQAILPVTVCDSASSSSAVSPASTVWSILNAPSAYHVCRARRCHSVLHMVCLGEWRHTGEELLKLIHQEIKTWLTPQKLEMGTMVTDNGSNILSALRQGSLSHAPCMAHVFNLVVKRFLKCSPHLQDILTTSRKLCMHFSHSYTAKHTLLELQRQNGIPQHSPICDVSTRWNSTLHMLDRLYEQRKAITDFLMIQADRGTPLCNFNVNQWQLIRDTCRLLRPFEEATLFVSWQDYGMNDVIPLLHVLQHMLETMAGQGTGDMAFTSYSHMNPVGAELEEEEEEEEEELPSETQFRLGEMAGLSSQRTGEEEQEQPEELEVFEEGETEDPGTPWQYAVEMETGSPSESLAQMARSMLTCLRSDPRIVSICRRDDFWLSTLLDPRFRHKVGAFFKPTERENKLNYYKDILRRQLADAYLRHGPYSRRSDSRGPLRSPSTAMAAGGWQEQQQQLHQQQPQSSVANE
ncbi:LOW QUALITY PROTEIN: uncharacterized protein PAF06_000559 [Gastrophryne carolinensis]